MWKDRGIEYRPLPFWSLILWITISIADVYLKQQEIIFLARLDDVTKNI